MQKLLQAVVSAKVEDAGTGTGGEGLEQEALESEIRNLQSAVSNCNPINMNARKVKAARERRCG